MVAEVDGIVVAGEFGKADYVLVLHRLEQRFAHPDREVFEIEGLKSECGHRLGVPVATAAPGRRRDYARFAVRRLSDIGAKDLGAKDLGAETWAPRPPEARRPLRPWLRRQRPHGGDRAEVLARKQGLELLAVARTVRPFSASR